MANENDTSFELDAGKLLATLHLAAAQAVPNSIVVNTGIENPAAKPDPQNPGKTEFNSDNKSGDYQIGIIKPISYKVQIDITKDKKLADLYEKFKDAKEDDKKTNESKQIKSFLDFVFEADDKEEGSDKKLLDTNQEKDNQNDENEESDGNTITEKMKSYKIAQDIIKIYTEYINGCDKNFKNATNKYKELEKEIENNTKDKTITNFKQLDALFQEAIKEENKDRAEHKKKNIEEVKKACIEDLKQYVTTYSGKENASKIRETECVLFEADVDGKIKDASQFDKISNFKIETKDLESDIKKMEEEHQKKNQNEWITRNIGYLISFNLNFEE